MLEYNVFIFKSIWNFKNKLGFHIDSEFLTNRKLE
jgi:hypothetical protein